MVLTVEIALRNRIEAHKAGKLKEADRYYTAVLKSQPDHPDANHNMGVLAVSLGRVELALPFFKKALVANPSIEQFWLSFIDALVQQKQFKDAAAALQTAQKYGFKKAHFSKLDALIKENTSISNRDPSVEQLEMLAKLYSDGKLLQILKEAKKLLGQFPNSAILYNFCGSSKAGLGKFEDAIKYFKKCVKIQPDYAEGFNNMGMAYQDLGDSDKALICFETAIKINPNYAAAYGNLGLLREKNGDFECAISIFKKVINLHPQNANAYSNLGNNLRKNGQIEEAILAYKSAIRLNSCNSSFYNNLGISYKEQGKFLKALEAYNTALDIEPNSKEILLNKGNVLREAGDLEEAIKVYKRAVTLSPDFVEVKNNVGIVLQEQGKIYDAIEVFIDILNFNSENLNAWDSLAFLLHTLKYNNFPAQKNFSKYPKFSKSILAQISRALLDYKLNEGGQTSAKYLEKALEILSKTGNSKIKNPTYDDNNERNNDLTQNIVAMMHFGRSGTGLVHSLIDGHPQVSTLPSIFLSEFFDYATWQKIVDGGWDEVVDRFMTTYEVLFDATSDLPIQTKGRRLIKNIGVHEGLTNLGKNKNEVLRTNKTLFRKELKKRMKEYDELDPLNFFKLVHKAYDKAIDDTNTKNLIFYHIHNPDTCAKLNFIQFARRAKKLLIVREPIQSCESWVSIPFNTSDYSQVAIRIIAMLFEVDNSIYQNENSVGVRLEDIKNCPEKTILALCKWMGIKHSKTLYEMTMQSKKWWGDPTSTDYSKDGMNPFGLKSIRRKVGTIFSESDQFILSTLFYPFNVNFGYVQENFPKFTSDLKAIKPMLDENFDFENNIIERTKADPIQFKKKAAYLNLRSRLKERWHILDTYGTYPNMIKPL